MPRWASWRLTASRPSRSRAGNDTALTYSNGQTRWLEFTNTPGINGTIIAATSPGGRQEYGYDTAGRLTKVADTYNGTCVTRTYAFTANTNRSRPDTYNPATNGKCSTTSTPTTTTYTYDEADRLTTTGYTYDAFGRTTTVPKAHASGGADLTIGYHADDMVASMTQGTTSRTFTLDPEGRIRATTQTGGARPGMMVNHYDGQDDEPVWIAEADGSWSRRATHRAGPRRDLLGRAGGRTAAYRTEGADHDDSDPPSPAQSDDQGRVRSGRHRAHSACGPPHLGHGRSRPVGNRAADRRCVTTTGA
ncbi:hypothetical protein ACFSKW_34290 [Nonomuraea mangrovi]|uniref:RHS repeat protein n=1 Tax=Nonomuraea mangrovi TaxID=2316207 RepID=A0ABW4T848_9ACTN